MSEAPSGAPISGLSMATDLAEVIAALAGSSLRSVLLYGSHLQKTNPDHHSAIDFVLVVEEYRAFYQALKDRGELRRPVGLMARMSRLLAPSVIAIAPEGPDGGLAKCLVVDTRDLESALGPAPKDHFLLGRLVQELGYVYNRSPADEAWVRSVIAGAHARVLQWMGPYLEESVDAAGLGRRMMEVCYAGELRPEPQNRSDRVFDAQVDHMTSVLGPTLEAAVASGRMVRDGSRYRLTRPVRPSVRARWRRHFVRSKLRATCRWFKHMLTFDNWLPYVTRKVERHTGRTVRLTVLERKLPLIFLWPRAVHVLLTRPRREVSS